MERTRAGADKKRLQVNSAALVDLKAALFRKQQEYKKEKSSTPSGVQTSTATVVQDAVEGAGRKVSNKTSSVWLSASRKAKKKDSVQGVNGRSSKGEQGSAKDTSTQLSQYEEEQLAKSRRALEAKAAIYERLSRGEGLREEEEEEEGEGDGEGEEGSSRYMVDFTRKIWEDHMNSQSPPVSPTSSKMKNSSNVTEGRGSPSVDQSEEREPTPPPLSRDEEWVEYVDSFGRSRSCLRKDLPNFMKIDQQLGEKKEETKREKNRSPTPDLLSEDMRRERERRQWEQEAEEEVEQDKPVGPVHYQELRGGEVRTHGAGYYAFSMDEEQRREQMGLLNKLREQTTVQREKREKLQEKRKALLEARLAKVRQRKLKQNPEEASLASSSDATQGIADFDFDKGQGGGTEKPKPGRDEDLSNLLARAREEAELEQEKKEEEKRRAHVRPWDRGKVVDPIKKRKQELRDERLNEFAPPSIYSSSSSKPSSSNCEQFSSPKRPKTDDTLQDIDTTSSTTTPITQPAGSVPGSTPTPPTGYMGGYFYPPPGNFYPPPFGVYPPPPPGMVFTPPPSGGPYFAPPPALPVGVGVATHQQLAPRPTVPHMIPPPPPPGLPPDLTK